MNILLTGRNILTCYRFVNPLDRLHENFSVLPESVDLRNMEVFPLVESAGVTIPGGAEAMHFPPFPYLILAARIENQPIDLSLNFIYTPESLPLLQLFDFDTYPPALVDIFLMDKVSKGGYYFPSSIPRNLNFNYQEGNRVGVCSLGLSAPAGVLIPPNTAPPYSHQLTTVKAVRNFTATFSDEFNIPPLSVLSLSLSITNTIGAQHTMLASLPDSDSIDYANIRFPRIYSFGLPSASANLRIGALPSLPSDISGREIDIWIEGWDLDFTKSLLRISLRGIIQNVSTNIAPQDAIIWQISVACTGTETTPPITFSAP